MKLEEIADLVIGILTQREQDEKGANCYLLFSLKDYEEKQQYEEFRTNKDMRSKLTQRGDLLFRLLCPNKIVYVDENLEGMLVPSKFCIIRIRKEIMSPIVLKWYLESRQADLNSKITGSLIHSMSIANLKTLEIPDMAKEEQEKMEKLILLWEKEREISKQLLEEKEKLYHFYLEEMMKKGEAHVGREE